MSYSVSGINIHVHVKMQLYQYNSSLTHPHNIYKMRKNNNSIL